MVKEGALPKRGMFGSTVLNRTGFLSGRTDLRGRPPSNRPRSS